MGRANTWFDALGSITDDERLIKVHWASGSDAADTLWPHQLHYVDEVSTPFRLDVTCVAASPCPPLKTLIGQPVGFGVRTRSGGCRWLSGIVDAVRTGASISGFTPVCLQVRSALALLSRRRTCRVFQDQSVPQIVAAILDEHRQKSAVVGVSFDFQTRFFAAHTHSVRAYCVQYNESDAHFIQRLLAEEGIGYTYAFDAPEPGEAAHHQLILFDSVHGVAPSERRLHHRASAEMVSEQEDALISWQGQRSLIAPSLELASHDYWSNQVQVGADDSPYEQGVAGGRAARSLSDYTAQVPGYADSRSELDAYARRRLQAGELTARTFFGVGRLRELETGSGFLLEDHPDHRDDPEDQRDFIVTGQCWTVTNNLPQAWSGREVATGLAALAHSAPSTPACGDPVGYLSEFTAVRRGIPLTPPYDESLSKPTAPGPQTATVVGPEGETVHTDALGRIRIQWHWQRPQEHPEGTANLDERSSTWLRVALPSAGDGFGHQFLPRIGQEVVVVFLGGDIDRPLVTGVVYNGTHATPRFSGSTGLPGNRALSGIRTEEHQGGGYNELVFDDTPGEVRARLASSHHASALNLGKLVTPRTDGQAQPRGEGGELRSAAALALRAAQGMLLTTYAQATAEGHQLEREVLEQLLDQCGHVFKSLGNGAGQLGGRAPDLEPQRLLAEALKAWPKHDADGAPLPVLALTAESGITSATPGSHVSYAGGNHDQVAQQNLQLTSGQATRIHAGQGVDVFAHARGINAIANQGQVLIQAQNDALAINARTNAQLTASEGEVVVSAPVIRLVAEDGSFIRIGNGITLGTGGEVAVHADQHHWRGPMTDHFGLALPPPAEPVCLECMAKAALDGTPRLTL